MATAARYVIGLSLGTFFGLATGLLTASFARLEMLVSPLFNYLRAIPLIALLPIVLAVFGLSEFGKVALVAWGAFFPIWIGTHMGIHGSSIDLAVVARSMGASRLLALITVSVPSSMTSILSAIRTALATAFFALAAAESTGTQEGLIARVFRSQALFDSKSMVAHLILLGAVVLVVDGLYIGVTRRVFPWTLSA